MKIKSRSKRHLLKPFLAGFVIWALCMGFAAQAAWAAPARLPAAQEAGTATPAPEGQPTEAAPAKACAECHPDVEDAWMNSPHAHAYDDAEFSARWESLGEPGECLVCHTTGYAATDGSYSAPGVTCEACHGQPVADHPPAVIPVRADTEYCGTCHTTTLGEWRLTGHASANVGCTDCHNPHSQAALFENPDEMCVNCHKDDIGEHKNDIHITKGIGCVECHTLVLPPETPPVDGLAPTGHSFTITPKTCVACHTDTLHIGEPLPGYEDGAKAAAAGEPADSTIATVVAEYTSETETNGSLSVEQTIQALETALASARLSSLFQGGIIGLVLGGTTAYFIARNQRRESPPEAEEKSSETEEEV